MSNPPLRSKQSTRWGSLFSGAVANIESRLDTILADESTIASRNALLPAGAPTAESVSRAKEVVSSAQSRSSSVNSVRTQPNDGISRPSARDAVAHSSGSRTASQAREHFSPLASAITIDTDAKSRSSLDSTATDPVVITPNIEPDSGAEAGDESGQDKTQGEEDGRSATLLIQSGSSTAADSRAQPSFDKNELVVLGDETGHDAASFAQSLTVEEYQMQIAQMQSDYEAAELQRQEEVHSNLERIDALQSKLQYLAKEATDSARSAASQAPHDSFGKKLAAKDEQIALLMEEGQQLSKAEVAQSTAVRKLRIKSAEDMRNIAEMKQKVMGMERSSTDLSEKVRRLEISQKDASAKLLRLPRLEREISSLKAVRDEKESTIQALRLQLESESKRADEAAKQVNIAAVEEQRKLNESLQEDLSNAKIEKQLADDRSRMELRTAQDELQREQERRTTAELGLRNEIATLETRLESLRSQTEEASSGTTNDAQAKLLRQVETLQSQYALARENWQGIESSLQARVTALEKERAEITRQEAEARKKARESGNNARRLQESFEEASRKCQVLEHDLTQKQATADKLETRVLKFEKSLKTANEKLEQERQAWDSHIASRIEEEKAKWRQDEGAFASPESLMGNTEPPSTPLRRSNTLELPGIAGRRGFSRNASMELNIPLAEKSQSRRSSNMKQGRPYDVTSPNGFDSGRSTPFFNGYVPDAPSIHELDADETVETGSSHHRTVNEMISGSTSAAGPSVQLVERMSAKVRRLETEKAASRDELTRLSGQRDEARKEVVTLMREVEQKRAVDAKVSKMEGQMAQMEERYQTTLEMLGERSEKVEELEADVADLKKIYRELVESTIK